MKINNKMKWSTALPEDWAIMPLKYIVSQPITDGPHETPDFLDAGIPFVSAEAVSDGFIDLTKIRGFISMEDHFQYSKKYYPQKHDIFMVKSGATTGITAIVDTDLEFNIWSPLAVIRCGKLANPKFILYFMRSKNFQDAVALNWSFGTQQNIGMGVIGNLSVAIPSLSEQITIANHLDQETAQINALIAAKERLLSLLAEKRRTLITHAVTRGLDPKVPRRDSGIPWLGMIPEHWEIERARWLFKERDQRSETGEEELLTVSHLTGVTPRSEKDVNMFEAATTEGYKVCYKNDLVINTLWAWMGAMGVSPVYGIVSPAYNVYEPQSKIVPAYIDAMVRMPIFAQEVTRYSKGVWSSRLRLYPEGFFEVYLPLPPLSEQQDIVSHISNETAKIDALCKATNRTIFLLKERRAALITEAVTGKLKFPEVA